MQIKKYDESYIVDFEDGSGWRIWPGDIALTLRWLPTTVLQVSAIEDKICHMLSLINQTVHECARLEQVRIRPFSRSAILEERIIGKASTHRESVLARLLRPPGLSPGEPAVKVAVDMSRDKMTTKPILFWPRPRSDIALHLDRKRMISWLKILTIPTNSRNSTTSDVASNF